jgi:XTP/dITP diphosphohydrolase
MMRMLVATTNAGKLRDFAAALTLPADGKAVELIPLPGLKEIEAPAEDEDTFGGNARVKALYYSRFALGELVLADDSGLEVDALLGAPGVRSARYAEDSCFVGEAGMNVDQRNNACLVEALHAVTEERRTGRYRCVLVAARDGVVIAEGDGTVEGTIALSPRGEGGFGYDPYFVPEGESGTMAELDQVTRMRLSHRGRALKDLVKKI